MFVKLLSPSASAHRLGRIYLSDRTPCCHTYLSRSLTDHVELVKSSQEQVVLMQLRQPIPCRQGKARQCNAATGGWDVDQRQKTSFYHQACLSQPSYPSDEKKKVKRSRQYPPMLVEFPTKCACELRGRRTRSKQCKPWGTFTKSEPQS